MIANVNLFDFTNRQKIIMVRTILQHRDGYTHYTLVQVFNDDNVPQYEATKITYNDKNEHTGITLNVDHGFNPRCVRLAKSQFIRKFKLGLVTDWYIDNYKRARDYEMYGDDSEGACIL